MAETASVYEAAGGADGLLRLAAAWHERVLVDEIVSHAFSHGFRPDHTERLAAYWGEVLGGPTTYTDTIADESTVVRMHSGDGPHDDMNERAIACFDAALVDAGLAADPRLRANPARLLRVGDDRQHEQPQRHRRRRSRSPGHAALELGRTAGSALRRRRAAPQVEAPDPADS